MRLSSRIALAMTKYLLILDFLGVLISPSASAQVDLNGNWLSKLHQDYAERGPGPEIVDYMGTPLNAEARAKALDYSASQLSMPEHQCKYYPPTYLSYGPFSFKMWSETDEQGRLVAWKMSGAPDLVGTVIWMDGRPHPSSNALHTYEGFTTGKWEGDVLVTLTTHFKAGNLKRNGVPLSDEAKITRHYMRNGDFLTVTQYIEDPAYLTEPVMISRTWTFDPKTPVPAVSNPCNPETEVARFSETGTVPHYLPGQNPFVNELTKFYNIPEETILGGAETMYPEYRRRLRDKYVPPQQCVRYCCGWKVGAETDLIKCIGVGFSTPQDPFGRRF